MVPYFNRFLDAQSSTPIILGNLMAGIGHLIDGLSLEAIVEQMRKQSGFNHYIYDFPRIRVIGLGP